MCYIRLFYPEIRFKQAPSFRPTDHLKVYYIDYTYLGGHTSAALVQYIRWRALFKSM